MKEQPLRTTVIGSYPFPGWLEFACQNLEEFGEADREEMIDDAVVAAVHDQSSAGLDVITDGATKVEAIRMLRSMTEGLIPGLIIAVDRKERHKDGGNSVEALAEIANVEVRAIVTIYDILEHLPGREIDGEVAMTDEVKHAVEAYLSEYAVS